MPPPRLAVALPWALERPLGARERRFGRGRNCIRVWDIPALDAGPAAGRHPGGLPVFVLVHGWGVSSRLFWKVALRLQRHGRVLAFDLPGANHLPRPQEPIGIDGFATVAARALIELGIERPVLVGHSMGAQVVVAMARREPLLAGRMVLVSPVVPLELRSVPTVVRAFLLSARHERFGAAMWSVAGYLRSGLGWPLQILPSLLGYPIEDEVRGLGGDIRVVRGEYDLLCPQEWAEELLRRSGARGEVQVVEGAAHQVVVDDAGHIERAALAVAHAGERR